VVGKIAAAFEGFAEQRQREAKRERQRIESEKQRAEEEREWEEQDRLEQHEEKLNELAEIRRFNLGIAAQQWEDSERVLAFVNRMEKRWREQSADGLSAAQEQWLTWGRSEAGKLAPWSEKYPDVETACRCDPKTIPIGGPYPEVSRLKPHDFRCQEPKPQPSPYW